MIPDWTIPAQIGQQNLPKSPYIIPWSIVSGYRIHFFGMRKKANGVILPFPIDWFASIVMAKSSTVNGLYILIERNANCCFFVSLIDWIISSLDFSSNSIVKWNYRNSLWIIKPALSILAVVCVRSFLRDSFTSFYCNEEEEKKKDLRQTKRLVD